MTNKQVILGTVCSLLLGVAATRIYQQGRVVYARSTRTPFVVELEKHYYSGVGAAVLRMRETSTVALQSTGRRTKRIQRWINIPSFSAREEYAEWKEILDPFTKQQVVEYPLISRKSSTPLNERAALALQADIPSSCVPQGVDVKAEEAAPLPVGGGLKVVKVIQTFKDDSGQTLTITEEYKAPELDCMTVQASKRTEKDGKAVSREETRLVSLVRTDPPDSLFATASGFTETKPSDLLVADARLRGKTMSECVRKTGDRADQAYQAKRDQK